MRHPALEPPTSLKIVRALDITIGLLATMGGLWVYAIATEWPLIRDSVWPFTAAAVLYGGTGVWLGAAIARNHRLSRTGQYAWSGLSLALVTWQLVSVADLPTAEPGMLLMGGLGALLHALILRMMNTASAKTFHGRN